jgi:hypothetical protein
MFSISIRNLLPRDDVETGRTGVSYGRPVDWCHSEPRERVMEVEEFLAVVAVFALVVIPALALTARYALKPIVEAIVVLRDGLAGRRVDEDVHRRLSVIESELSDLSGAVRRLVEVHQYDRQLSSSVHPDGDPPG